MISSNKLNIKKEQIKYKRLIKNNKQMKRNIKEIFINYKYIMK